MFFTSIRIVRTSLQRFSTSGRNIGPCPAPVHGSHCVTAIVQVNYRPILSSERALKITNPKLKEISKRKKNWSRVPDWRLTPGQTGRLTVGRKLTSTSIILIRNLTLLTLAFRPDSSAPLMLPQHWTQLHRTSWWSSWPTCLPFGRSRVQESTCLMFFLDFPHSLRANVPILSETGHDRVLPHNFQLITNSSPK
jgi:hypothetical protein